MSLLIFATSCIMTYIWFSWLISQKNRAMATRNNSIGSKSKSLVWVWGNSQSFRVCHNFRFSTWFVQIESKQMGTPMTVSAPRNMRRKFMASSELYLHVYPINQSPFFFFFLSVSKTQNESNIGIISRRKTFHRVISYSTYMITRNSNKW